MLPSSNRFLDIQRQRGLEGEKEPGKKRLNSAMKIVPTQLPALFDSVRQKKTPAMPSRKNHSGYCSCPRVSRTAALTR